MPRTSYEFSLVDIVWNSVDTQVADDCVSHGAPIHLLGPFVSKESFCPKFPYFLFFLPDYIKRGILPQVFLIFSPSVKLLNFVFFPFSLKAVYPCFSSKARVTNQDKKLFDINGPKRPNGQFLQMMWSSFK